MMHSSMFFFPLPELVASSPLRNRKGKSHLPSDAVLVPLPFLHILDDAFLPFAPLRSSFPSLFLASPSLFFH
jgi:hypothetical protein